MERNSEVTLKSNKCNTSKELLSVKGDGSQRCIVKSLLKRRENCTQNKNLCQTFRINRSPLFDQLQEFLPKFEKSTAEILEKPEHERDELDIENIEGCSTVVEMSILLGQTVSSDSSDSESSSDEDEETPTICPLTFKLNVKDNSESLKKNLITEINDFNEKELKVGEDNR